MSRRFINFAKFRLSGGNHECPSEGMCVNEAVAYIAGEKFSDYPKCVADDINSLTIMMNDDFTDEERQEFVRPLIWGMIGSKYRTAQQKKQAASMMREALERLSAFIGTSLPDKSRSHFLVHALEDIMDMGRDQDRYLYLHRFILPLVKKLIALTSCPIREQELKEQYRRERVVCVLPSKSLKN